MKKQKSKDKFINTSISGYEIEKRVAAGNFGTVYVAKHALNGIVAIKIEVIDRKDGKGRKKVCLLEKEHEFYVNHLKDLQCVPKFISFLSFEDKKLLAMELFDIDLRHCFEDKFNNKFSKECISKLLYTMTSIIEQVHSKYIVYRDMKPDNYLIKETSNGTKIVLADYGLSTFYMQINDTGNIKHVPFKKGLPFVGTTRYASINSHRGVEQSRRDDLESLIFVIGYLSYEKGLPWQGLPIKSGADRNELVKNEKIDKWKTLFDNIDCKPWQEYLHYVHALDFQADPDYDYLKRLSLNGSEFDSLLYDWEISETQQRETVIVTKNSIVARSKKETKFKKAWKRFSGVFKK